MKKLVVTAGLILGLMFTGTNSLTVQAKESSTVSEMTAQEVVDDMGVGWNLGNTLDAYNYSKGFDANLDSETYWTNPKTTKAMIDKVADSGFKAVRIPVTYYNHLDENNNIDEKWLDRVEEVVNYALDNDLYVVMNIHHDAGMEGWIYADTDTYANDSVVLKHLWKQIATRFKNYDEKLLFEGTNEILNKDRNWDWGTAWKDFRVVHDLNQDFINTVRSTGGKNANRFLVISTWGASTDSCQIEQLFYKDFTDSATDKLILSVHNYTATISKLDSIMQSLDKYSTKYNIPIIIDEFGTKSGQGMSEDERAESAAAYVSKAKAYGMTCFVWDDGCSYALLNRQICSWNYPKIVKAIITSAGLTYSEASYPNLDKISFADTSNWKSGNYDYLTGIYKTYQGRACLNTYVTVDKVKYTVKAPTNYRILIREMAKDGTFLRTYNLASGKTYTRSDDAAYIGISLYNTANTSVSFDTYKSLLANKEITFTKNTGVTILSSMYSTNTNYYFTDSTVPITNKTQITLQGTMKKIAYGDMMNAANGKYVFRLENTNGIYRRISWWNNKVADAKENASFTIKQNGRRTDVTVDGKSSTDFMVKDIDFSGQGVKLNLYLVSFKELKIANESGVLIRDYVPALDAAGTPCIYDKVNAKCYYFADTSHLHYQ